MQRDLPIRRTPTQPAEDAWAAPTQEKPRAKVPSLRAGPALDWRLRMLPLLRDPVVSMLRLQRDYGDIVALGTQGSAPVLIFSPDFNRQLLTNPHLFYSLDVNSSDSPLRAPKGSAASVLLSGVAGMNGEKHTQHRRMLMPGFHKTRVDALCGTVAAVTEKHIAHWKPGQTIDLAHEMVELSLSLALSGLMGLQADARQGEKIHYLVERWNKVGMSPQTALLPFDIPGMPYRRFARLSEQLRDEFLDVIRRKRENSVDDGDALSILLDAQEEGGDKLTDTELLGHLTTLFTAGHETTASALTWTLFLLTQHPSVMADLLDELESKLHGAAPTLEQMRELPLLEGVINEGLRLFPPGIWMLRTSTGPFNMGGYEFPSRTHLIFSPAVTHRRPDLYPQPNKFLPQRWETIKPSTYEFLPFGGGPRRCLGATFAMLELRVALPIILQRFRLGIRRGTRVDRAGLVLSFPKGALPVQLSAQDGNFQPAGVCGNVHDLLDFGSGLASLN